MAGNKSQVLSLYRQFLRNASKFEDYNFRNYFLRKSRDEFKKHKDVSDPAEIANFIKSARQDLLVLKRQAEISQMYHFDKLVVEKLDRHHRT
ncbi:unnamed protein product [Kuraishia capsulata CBS 1993]|uniref:Complex 1 LYR protein domain-containing protein n=1 Tax=Kuraishia capsulata CBS 1993 TaxID=1382522 RepID=W6MQP9_9ASCO|nr:uncharacterized protein KUCA_T00004657001 [Kuraishia capsulata CBS 1993]CDK28673.1 unnamed protein product [Kuraishia capsulata CBS 1993]